MVCDGNSVIFWECKSIISDYMWRCVIFQHSDVQYLIQVNVPFRVQKVESKHVYCIIRCIILVDEPVNNNF